MAFSKAILPPPNRIKKIDMSKINYVFLDGGHEYETVKNDLNNCMGVINNNGTDVKFFNTTFLKTVIFLCLGILVYWLIIKKVIQSKFFTSEDEEDYQ